MSVEIQRVKHSRHLTEWSEMVRECRNSGMTVKAWCREHGLNEKTYYNRQKQVCNAIPENSAVVPVQFTEIRQPDIGLRKTNSAISIHIGNAEITVDKDADLAMLKSVIRIVSGIC